MKKAILFVLMLTSLCSWGEKAQPVPADYTIAVHVQSSRTKTEYNEGRFYAYQQLSVVSDGKHYKIRGDVSPRTSYVLRVGDYRARILKPDAGPAYEYKRTYQFLFPDGQTRDYEVVGEEE